MPGENWATVAPVWYVGELLGVRFKIGGTGACAPGAVTGTEFDDAPEGTPTGPWAEPTGATTGEPTAPTLEMLSA